MYKRQGPTDERLKRLSVQHQADASCYARMLCKQDYQIDWSNSALAIHRQVMGLYPGAQTSWNGKRLKLTQTEPLIDRLKDQLSPEAQELVGQWPTGGHAGGTVLACIQDLGLVVSSSGCPLLIREAQLEGKSRSRGQALVQQMAAAEHQCLGDN